MTQVNLYTADQANALFVKRSIITLSNADIKQLPVAPSIIVPAPGVGKMLAFLGATLVSRKPDGPYTVVPGDIYAESGMSLNNFGLTNESPGSLLLTAGASHVSRLQPIEASAALVLTRAQAENMPILLYVNTATGGSLGGANALTGGGANNSLTVVVAYYEADLD